MCQDLVPQARQALLNCLLWSKVNFHFQNKNVTFEPLHHIQKASTFCNIELTKVATTTHHIDQSMQKQLHVF
jgi:hypothetical protein